MEAHHILIYWLGYSVVEFHVQAELAREPIGSRKITSKHTKGRPTPSLFEGMCHLASSADPHHDVDYSARTSVPLFERATRKE
jgi:hypothetical protein